MIYDPISILHAMIMMMKKIIFMIKVMMIYDIENDNNNDNNDNNNDNDNKDNNEW